MTNYLLLLNITKIVISRIYPKKTSYKIKEFEIANSLPCHIILNYFIFLGKHDERFDVVLILPQQFIHFAAKRISLKLKGKSPVQYRTQIQIN